MKRQVQSQPEKSDHGLRSLLIVFRATCISVALLERKIRQELKLMTPVGSGPLRPNGALRALTPPRYKIPFNLFTDSRSWELSHFQAVKSLDFFTLQYFKYTWVFCMKKTSIAKNWFRSPVPSQGHHAAVSHHINKYFNSQVTLFILFFLIIALGECDAPERKQRDGLHSLDTGLHCTGAGFKKIHSAFGFWSLNYWNLFRVKGTQYYMTC